MLDPGSAIIQTNKISKVFEGGVDTEPVAALEDITLTVKRGELVALLGVSGCGKSTLLNIVAGLDECTTGTVQVLGEKPRPRQEVGLMFQRSYLFPWRNINKNVLLPAEIIGIPEIDAVARAELLLAMVGLEGWGLRYPQELSGGMQQRVALARVLLPDPDILLLDEPFGALDERTRETLDFELHDIVQRTSVTVLMVTHSIYEAVMVADRVCVLTPRPGQVAGTVEIPFGPHRDPSLTGRPEFANLIGDVRKLLESSPLP